MDRVTADAPSDHSWQPQPSIGSQALEVRLRSYLHHVVDVFLLQLFLDGLQGDFELINRLRLWLEFMVFSSMGPQTLQSSGFKFGEFGATHSSQWGQFACTPFSTHSNAAQWGCLG